MKLPQVLRDTIQTKLDSLESDAKYHTNRLQEITAERDALKDALKQIQDA